MRFRIHRTDLVRSKIILLFLLSLTLARAHEPVAEPSQDARLIVLSRALSGASSYATQAQLGLAYLAKARTKVDRTLYAMAERQFLVSLSYQPNFDAYLGLAMVCSDLHEFKPGLVYAEQAVTLLPGHPEAEGVRFDILLALGETERAAATLEKMLGGKPGFGAWSRQANFLESKGDFEGAVQAMGKATRHAHERSLAASIQAWALTRLGQLQARTENWSAAERSCDEALELNPKDRVARAFKSSLLNRRGESKKAKSIGLRLVHQRSEFHSLLLLSDLMAANEPAAAAKYRQQAIQLLQTKRMAGDRSELRPLALLLLDRDETVQEGLSIAWEDWHRRKDPLTTDILAWAYYRSGRLSEAAGLADSVLASGTRDARALMHTGKILEAAGRTTEAQPLLREARSSEFWLSHEERAWLAQGERVAFHSEPMVTPAAN